MLSFLLKKILFSLLLHSNSSSAESNFIDSRKDLKEGNFCQQSSSSLPFIHLQLASIIVDKFYSLFYFISSIKVTLRIRDSFNSDS